MTGRRDDKVCVAPGESMGIGKAITEKFVREGGNALIIDRDGELAVATAAETGAEAFRADVTVEAGIADGFGEVGRRHGGVNVLVTCSGGSVPEDGPITDADLDTFDRSFRLDVPGTIHASRPAIPLVLDGGSIATLSSSAVLMGYMPWRACSSGESAVISLTKAVAGYYAGQGIRVDSIAPGIVATRRMIDRQEKHDWKMGKVSARYDDDHPFGFGVAADIARHCAVSRKRGQSDDHRYSHGR